MIFLKTLQDEKTNASNVGNESSSSGSKGYSYTKIPDNDNNNVNILFSSPSPFLTFNGDENSTHQDPKTSSGAIEKTKKKMKARKSDKVESKTKVLQKKRSTIPSSPNRKSSSTIGAESDNCGNGTKSAVQDKKYRSRSSTSRIPRPTSAHSKKSLTAATPVVPIKPKSKTSRYQLEKVKSGLKPPASPVRKTTAMAAPKMQRSISLRNAEAISGGVGNSFSSNAKSIRASSQSHSRPRSALTSTYEDKSVGTTSSCPNKLDSRCDVRTTTSKRQCAASFSTRRKKESKPFAKQQSRNTNDEFLASFPNELYPYFKGGIPSKQAILTAIRREGSDIYKLKSSSRIQLKNTESFELMSRNSNTNTLFSQAPSIPTSLPKRSFNMTFECPICISSLVPGNNNYEKGCPEGTTQCPNVVTPCGHLFHGKCMENWLKIKGNKRCPICSALCLPETLQPVYLECNLCADLNPKTLCLSVESNGLPGVGMDEITSASYRTLRSEFELLKAKYNAILAENHNYSLNVSLATSLQSAYEMECRNRLQLQWENRKLLMKIEELKNTQPFTLT